MSILFRKKFTDVLYSKMKTNDLPKFFSPTYPSTTFIDLLPMKIGGNAIPPSIQQKKNGKRFTGWMTPTVSSLHK